MRPQPVYEFLPLGHKQHLHICRSRNFEINSKAFFLLALSWATSFSKEK